MIKKGMKTGEKVVIYIAKVQWCPELADCRDLVSDSCKTKTVVIHVCLASWKIIIVYWRSLTATAHEV